MFVVSFWLWHAPQLFELTLETPSWHYLEHACFFGAGLLFWYPVIQPYPSRPQLSRWLLLPYLFAAGLQGTLLSALLTFADHVLYPHYARVPRLWEISALTDQALAGAIMWILGSIAFLIPLVWIGQNALRPSRGTASRPAHVVHGRSRGSCCRACRRPPAAPGLFPATTCSACLRWGGSCTGGMRRLAMQLPLLVLAVVVILDGLLGPQVAALNLAGVLPWIVWRGLLVFGLLLAGNLFCMACPFMLVRGFAKRWLPGNRAWPPWLAGKWPAVLLLVVFFWVYEHWRCWDSPQRTACVAIAYFALAFAVDGFFRSAGLLQTCLPDRAVQFRQRADVAAGGAGPRSGGLRPLYDEGLHLRA